MRNRYFFSFDLIALPLAIYLSFVLRIEDFNLANYVSGWLVLSFICMLVVPLLLWRNSLYARYWPYASTEELLLLIGIVTLAVLLSGGLAYPALRAMGFVPLQAHLPLSISPIAALLSMFFLAAPRLLVRMLTWDYRHRLNRPRKRPITLQDPQARRDGLRRSLIDIDPILIIGAGGVGVRIARELRLNPGMRMQAVGFLDDDMTKQGTLIQGVPVLGRCAELAKVIRAYAIKHVIIAMPTAPGKFVRAIVKDCEATGVQVNIMPGMCGLLDGTVSINQLRKVEIDDLLRRAPVQTDVAAVSKNIKGRRVLVTGGGGSIGSELCRQILRFQPAELILLGHGENSIFEIHAELSGLAARTKISPVIADIRFLDRVAEVFDHYRPEMVFHAAAHKHVPLMELNPVEAITNNIMGTRNLLAAAATVDVECFVMISSDKAVRPTSVMGVSKRIAELLVRQAACANQNRMEAGQRSIDRHPRRYCAVRFGNVLGSRGSVVLTFKKQIAAGGPVTITHPDMKRFFMTIPEAVQLVLQASAINQGGEVFVLDMGEPIRIYDLAQDLIRLSGLEVGRDIEIVSSGIRPGEKLFEELFLPDEHYERTLHEKIFIARNASQIVPPQLDERIATLEEAAARSDEATIFRTLQLLVPEYRRETNPPVVELVTRPVSSTTPAHLSPAVL